MGEDDDQVRVRADVTFTCPFCVLCTVIVGEAEGGDTFLLHTDPACEVFLSEEPASYLRRARRRFMETDLRLS